MEQYLLMESLLPLAGMLAWWIRVRGRHIDASILWMWNVWIRLYQEQLDAEGLCMLFSPTEDLGSLICVLLSVCLSRATLESVHSSHQRACPQRRKVGACMLYTDHNYCHFCYQGKFVYTCVPIKRLQWYMFTVWRPFIWLSWRWLWCNLWHMVCLWSERWTGTTCM